eukprot:GEZU01007732.1.p1 GENE.GEZU01007732.1~~GEZU01007732.1.p1  ORF type:complete len:488 (+),score=94.05 GEZU01007732.1:75-1466(+)
MTEGKSTTEQIDQATVIFVELLPLMLIMIVGFASGKKHLMTLEHSTGIIHFLFNACLPASIFSYLINNSFSTFNWRFVLAFVIYKAIFAAFAVVMALVPRFIKKVKGEMCYTFVRWYMLSSLGNSVVVGYPIISLLFGKPFGVYCFMALVLDQWLALPVCRILLDQDRDLHEYYLHATHDDHDHDHDHHAEPIVIEHDHAAANHTEDHHHHNDEADPEKKPTAAATANGINETTTHNNNTSSSKVKRFFVWLGNVIHPDIEEQEEKKRNKANTDHHHVSKWKRVLFIVLHAIFNPIIIATVAGSIYSGSGIPVPAMLNTFLGFLANCISGMSLFIIGLFIAQTPLKTPDFFGKLGVSLVLKHIISPLVMLGIALAVGLRGEVAQVATIIAAMPLAVSAFILHMEYLSSRMEQESLLFSEMILIGNVGIALLLSIFLPVMQRSSLLYYEPTTTVVVAATSVMRH